MFTYYLKLATKSVLSTPWLTALTVAAIGLGIAVPTTIISIHHLFAQNPIPHKSDVLYNVRVDSWDPNSQFFDIRPGDPPKHVTYRDMAGMMESDIPTYRTGIAAARIFVFPEDENLRPYQTLVRLCHTDFFPMFEVPFQFGSGWSRDTDVRRERVLVLSREANEKLFGGRDSVGETLRLGPETFTVVGVLDHYRPTPQYYDVINNSMGKPREIFVPFDLIREPSLDLSLSGDTDSWGPSVSRDDPDAFFTASEVTWIQYWVEVAPDRIEAYRDFVDNYTLAQKELGRFPRPINNRVTPLMEWMEVRGVVPPPSIALVIISLLFLAVCCLNLMGLLLGKFLSRSGVLGVHRALGASKASVFYQRLLECELVGVIGGVAGVALAALALRLLSTVMPSFIMPADLFQVDGFSLVVALGLALLAGLASGLYPAWRACRIAPAIQLKLQ
jgi:putative ABC transport system permease protein